MSSPLCATCRFFVALDGSEAGTCHCFPPSRDTLDARRGEDAPARVVPVWQLVARTDWCGEHRPALPQ